MGWIQRPPPVEAVSDSPRLAGAGKWEDEYPALVEFLTLVLWEDNTPRVPGTLLVFAERERWKACLNDKDGGRVGFVTSDDPDTLLLAVEMLLREGKVDFRPVSGDKRSRR